MFDTAHPVFSEILTRAAAQPATLRMAAYMAALRKFDWQHDWSDDGRRRQRGREALEVLHHEQECVDPSGAVWRSLMPADHGLPMPRVVSEAAS